MIYSSNVFLIIVLLIIVFIYFKKLGYGKRAVLYTGLMLPAFFFSTNMLMDVATTDEAYYMPAFSNPSAIEPYSVMWNKGTNQYRVTEIVECTIFRIWRGIYPELSDATALIAYKIIHWFMFLGIILLISYVWSRFIIMTDKETPNYRLANFGILYILIGMPVACLLLKVCNYDAGNVYFAILGLSLCIAADRQKRSILAYGGVVVSIFGALEKFVSLMYWCLCVCFFAFLLMRECKTRGEKVKKCIIAVLSSVLTGTLISMLTLLYIRFIYGKGIIDFTFKKATMPLLYEFQYFIRYIKMLVSGEWNEVNDNVGITYIVIIVFLIILSAVFYLLYGILSKKIKYGQTVITKVNCIMGVVSLLIGVIAVYKTARYSYGIAELPQDAYISQKSVNGSLILYGAKTVVGHYVALVSNEYGIVYAAYPTVVLIIIAIAFLVMNRKYDDEYILQAVLSSSVFIVLGFGIFGQLGAPRYLAVEILLIAMVGVYYLCKINFNMMKLTGKVKSGIVFIVMLFYTIEMILYLPVFTCFAPLWIIRNQEFKNRFEMGVTYIGEAYTWGQELAIAGKMIEAEDGKSIDNNEVTIITNYGGMWLSNPGYTIMRQNEIDSSMVSWDENTYFILSKFVMFRFGIPSFLFEVEPYKRIEYNGETTVWIYRADQLLDYKDIFWNEYA